MGRWTWLFMALLAGCSRGEAKTPRPLIVVLAPLDVEFEAVVRQLGPTVERGEQWGRQIARARAGEVDLLAVRTGWGKAQAAGAAGSAIASYHPSAIILAGIGGALAESKLQSGDVVIVSEVFQHDLGRLDSERNGGCDKFTPFTAQDPKEGDLPAVFTADPWLTTQSLAAADAAQYQSWFHDPCECKTELARAGARARREDPLLVRVECENSSRRATGRTPPLRCVGSMATGDQFLVGDAAAQRLGAHKPGVIDMEGAAVAEEAGNQGVPFAIVRVIDDVIAGGSEDDYYCLKGQAAARLSSVMGQLFIRLSGPRAKVSPPPARHC